MLDQPASGNGPATLDETMDELNHMAIMLAGFCDGLDALFDTASYGQGEAPDLVTRRARNAMVPLIDTVITKAHELSDAIGDASLTFKRERRA